jgi:putative ABC transport system permease protein
MTSYALRLLRSQPMRLVLTIGGVALCVVLMLFLLSIYRGVADGSVDYIRERKTDLWVLQQNSTNILRGFSILQRGHGVLLSEISGVQSISPILFLLSTVRRNDRSASIFLTGYDPTNNIGAPRTLSEGRQIVSDSEIVIDKAFAAKMKLRIGQNIQIRDVTLKIVGLSEGTNMFVIQYGFVSLKTAQAVIGLEGIVSCYLVNIKESQNVHNVAEVIRQEIPGVEVYSNEQFLQNNIREMESGFLPLLYAIAGIGGIVLTTILSLILSINILERRKDFAILKTLGSPAGFLPKLVVAQGFALSFIGSLLALVVFFPTAWLIEILSPDVSTKSSWEQIMVVFCTVALMSLISSFFSLQRLRRIYPTEAFT